MFVSTATQYVQECVSKKLRFAPRLITLTYASVPNHKRETLKTHLT